MSDVLVNMNSHDLSHLGPQAFENIVNFLVLRELGLGATGFGPGPDGGRDGYFEGEAPYPSKANRWKGTWYVQSKFHTPHLTQNAQRWLIGEVQSEIEKFEGDQTDRKWPDNWIIATNIDQSGKPETGSFDAIRKLLKKTRSGKRVNLAIWGGRKILDLLAFHPEVATYYGHLLTPGHILSALYEHFQNSRASIEEIVRYFVVTQFSDHQFTKLDQAGSSADIRPGVHDLFVDLPYAINGQPGDQRILAQLFRTSAQCHCHSLRKLYPESWSNWNRCLSRARTALIKGGPGQGKSTVGQYFSQINRAKIILDSDGPAVTEAIQALARAVRAAAERDGFWPSSARIPVQIELKEFAHWFSLREKDQSCAVLVYLAEMITKRMGCEVLPKILKQALGKRTWSVIFDGLDEVPNDFKDLVANEVMYFLNDLLLEINSDALSLCTSRPQGYSGQFSGLDGPTVELSQLDPATAMRCADPVLRFGRTQDESEKSASILETAIRSSTVRELMTTPLQSHIMAVVVRDGGRPPERRWQLFNSFYQVMKKRESQKNFRNPRISRLLGEEDRLLKSVHMRLGFVLHARAEKTAGAQTTLKRQEFRNLVRDVVQQLVDQEIEETVSGVMEATTERLVLVNTPDSGDEVRFDIRQLQEFFAAEFLYAGVDSKELASRIETIGGDAHWREVMHFLLSALIENQRSADLAIAVQTLRRLDEGDDAEASTFSRRMSRAGLLASRLLLEGVVEQDLRDRQQIRPLLDALPGVIDLATLRGLERLGPPRSRQWFVQLLLDRLTRANPREYVGALYLLGWMLPGEHPETDLARISFLNLPIELRSVLLKEWRPTDKFVGLGPRQRPLSEQFISPWVTQLAISILSRPDWIDYSAETIRYVLSICRLDTIPFAKRAAATGISAEAASVVEGCFAFSDAHDRQHRVGSKFVVDFGFGMASQYQYNWVNQRLPKQLAKLDAEAVLMQVDGFFRLVLACIWFAKERSVRAGDALVAISRRAGHAKMTCLPNAIAALIPVPSAYSLQPFEDSCINDLALSYGTPRAEAITKAIEEKIGKPISALVMHASSNSDDADRWALFTNVVPLMAVEWAFESNELPWQRRVKFIPELVQLIERNSANSASSILRWGSLKDNAPDLLERLKASVRSPDFVPPRVFRIYSGVIPFELRFPDDAPILGLLGPALIQRMLGSDPNNPRWRRAGARDPSVARLLQAYAVSPTLLRQIAESDRYNQRTRAGALALFWLSRGEASLTSVETTGQALNIIQERSLYGTLVDSHNSSWLTMAVVQGVLLPESDSRPEVVEFVTYLLNQASEGAPLRDRVADLIRNWRERSSAPVQSRQMQEKWLQYSFHPAA